MFGDLFEKVQGKCALDMPTVASTEYILYWSVFYWKLHNYYTDIRALNTPLWVSEADDELLFFFYLILEQLSKLFLMYYETIYH